MSVTRKHLPKILALALITGFVGSSDCAQVSASGKLHNQHSFYVSPDGSDLYAGSATFPWKTIQFAANMVTPGTTVHVAPGLYRENVTSQVNGTPSTRIRFVSDVRWGARIHGNSEFVWNNKGDYVDIEGFDVSGQGEARIGILNWASSVRVMHNRVHDIPAPSCPHFGGAGIDHAGYASTNSDTLSNWIFNIGDYNHPCPRVHGIYQAEAAGLVQNNIIYRAEGWGIHLYHAAHDLIVANNTIFNNAYGGILIGQDLGKEPIADNNLVTNNIVFHNGLVRGADGYGIREYGSTGMNNKYFNNLVYGNGPGDWRLQNGNVAHATIASDPAFINYQADGSGDYHLKKSSPAIDRGTDLGAPADDFDANRRPDGADFDIGAYETQTASASGEAQNLNPKSR